MSNSGNNVHLNLPNVTDANLEEAEIGSAPATPPEVCWQFWKG